MRRPIISWILVSLSFLTAWIEPASAKASKKILQEQVASFNTAERSVRSDHLLLPVNYVEYAGQSYSYFVPRRLARLAWDGEKFQIRKVSYESNNLRFKLESSRKAVLTLTAYDNGELSQVFLDKVAPAILNDLFDFGDQPGARFIGNTTSRVVHFRASNHLPQVDKRVELTSIDEAEAQGFKPCTICFSDNISVPIEGYGPLRLEALEAARTHELVFPPVPDKEAQERLQKLGESIVNVFPIETRGFEYTFKILHSEFPNAVSYPTGFVYVTDKLMSAIEDSAELILVLSHEIAHCELSRKIERPSSSGVSAEMWEGVIDDYYERIRFRETEADLMAFLCLQRMDNRPEAMAIALKSIEKIAFCLESVPSDPAEFDTQPSLASRVRMFRDDSFQPIAIAMNFVEWMRTTRLS